MIQNSTWAPWSQIPSIISQQLTLIKGKWTFVSNYSGMSIVAEKISLALKVNYKQMYHANVKRDWSLEKCGVSEKPSEWVSKRELEALSPVTASSANPSTKNSNLLPDMGVSHSCPYSKCHPSSGSVPRFLNSTKCSSFHDVHFLTSVRPLTSSHFYLQVVLLYASTYVLVSLSIDRYHAIVYPMKFLQGGELAQTSTILGWGFSLILSS